MKKIYLKFILLFLIGLMPIAANATHIVGGVLTYTYNGSNNYTLSLILYRDCAGAAYPTTATVQIKQADGTTYGTLTLNPGTATTVPYTLDSCAQAPSPIPCVEKRTYTGSITLPPTTNGYHLYYSLCCRNSTLSNTTTSDQTTNQDGESFYAFIPGRLAWDEDFTLTNGTTSDAGSTAWTRTLGTTPPTSASVQTNVFEFNGANNAQATWTSQFIKTSSYTSGVNMSVDLAETSNLEANDSILVYYRTTSGGALTQFTTNGFKANDFGTATASVSSLVADSVQIVVRVHYDGSSAGEIYDIDNILVYNAVSNNTPVYTQFPPLFMCAGKAFSVDHSATDADGDSLYYSFYTPYCDAAPTFSGNVATFTPIIWNSGYSASSPLNSGGPALTLNSSTGLLTGTGNTIGQFQVGIKTTEYRKGVKLSDMVRDFQFNVINCPAPAQAYITASGVTNGTLSVCSGNSITFPNNSDATATNWTWDFGDLTTTTDVSTLQYPSYTYPGVGTYTARLIINAGTACADTATAVVTVTTPPATPTASGTTICQGSTATLTATAPGGTYDWYDASSGGTHLSTGASYTTPTLTVTTTYYVQTTISGCASARKAVTVTVTSTPAAPTASGATICSGSTATLTATAPGGTYAWYTASSGGTLLVTNASYTTPTLTVTTTYYVQTTVSGCTGPRTAVTVTVNPIPAAPTASGATICSGSTATLTATAPGGTYDWYDASSGGTLLATNASYTTPTLTVTTTYYVQTTVSGCTGARTAVTVTVNPIPAAPTASGAAICSGSTATLTATAPGGTYDWYTASSGGTLLATNASYTTPTLTVTTTYYVQSTISGCTGARTAVTVTVSPTPAAPTASGATICSGSTATLTATAPGGTYAWYDASSGGTLLVTNASYTTPTLTVTTTYYVQTTVSGCAGPRTAVTVTVNPIPAAPTASGTTICQGATATLTATAPGGTYAWYDAASGGTLLVTNASYTTPSLSANTTYYVQTTVSGCTGPRTAVTVTVTPTPAAPTASGTTICTNTTATLTATAPGGTYAWYDAASGGTLLVTNASYTTPVLTTNTTYYVQTTVSGCVGPRTAVTVTVSPVPAAPTASGTTICQGTTATLTATAPGGTYDWYDAASGGTLLVTNASYTTPSLSANTTYYVQTTVAGCAGPRTAVTVTVTPTPAAPTASGTTICTNTTATLTATAPGGTYDWYDAASGGTLLVTNASYTTPTLTVTTTYYVQTTVSGCPGPRTAVTVTVSPVPAAPTASGTTICQGTTTTLTATAPGGTYAWYNAASGGTLLVTNASYTTPALSSTTTYYVQTTVAGCAGPRTAVTVTVTPTPAAPTASGTTICTNTTATLTATAPGGTYDWYTASSGGTLLATNSSYTTPVLTTNTTYYVQATVSGCVGPRTAVTVTVSPVPAAPTASGTAICTNTSTTLTATAPGGTYDWYDAASGGTLLATNSSYTTPVLTTSTTYYVQTTVAGCAGPRTAVPVTVSPVPAAPTASSVTICTSTSTTLTATAPGGTYDWYDAASGGTLLTTNANYTTPVLTSNTTYYVQTTVGGCTGPRTAVTVTVSPVPAAPTASGTTICTSTSTTLTATAPGGNYDWYDAASGGTLLVTNASYTTPVLTSNTTYYVQTTVAGCAGPRTAVTVTVSPVPAAPTASNTTICDGSTAILSATAPGGTYQWYDASSGGTLLATNANYTTPALSSTTVYYVQTTVAGCTGPRTAVTVVVNPIPASPTASGTTICQSTTATLTATAPGGTYQWYDAASGGTLLVTNSSYTTPALSSTTTYYVQTTVSGCASATRTPVTVTVTPTPATPTAAGTNICTGSTATLTATAPGGTYDWYTASSGGTLLVTNASYTTPVLSSTATYYVQTTISGCASARKAVTVTVHPFPAAPTAANATICDGSTTTLTATAPGGSYQWYDASSGGTLLVTNANYTTPALSATTTYYVQTTVSGCTSTSRTPVTVTVNPIPASPTASGTTICQSTTATLNATAPGGTYDWYDAATGGTLLVTNASYTTPSLSATTTYYVQTTVTGCTSPRTPVTVNVTPTPATPTAAGTTICNGSTATLTATAPGGTYDWYDAASGGTLLVTNASYTTPALSATTTYYVQTTVSGCASARKAVTVTVTPTDDPSFNYSSGTYCVTGSNPTPTITGGFPGTFSSSPAGLTFVSSTTGQINVSASTLNTYTVTYTTSGPCPSSDAVNVTITNAPNATFNYSGPYCQGDVNPLPNFNAGASAGIFSASPAGLTFASSSTGEIDLGTTTPGTYTLTNTIAAAGGCAAASYATTVTINPAATVSAGPSQSICAGSTATLAGTLGGAATSGTWSGGTGSFSSNTNLSAVYTPGPGETTAILTLTTNDPAGPCAAVSDTVVITINPIPVAPTASNDTICSGSTSTLTATAPGGTYKWYTAASGGTLLATNANYTTPALSSTTTYYVQTTVNGCTSNSRTPVTVTVNSIPAAPTAADATICDGSTATLTATAPGGTYAWYDAATGGTLLVTNASYTTPALSTATTYYVQTTVAGCTGTRTPVTVNVNSIPTAPTAADATICSGTTATLTATAPGGTYDWYDAASGGTLLITNASYTTPALSTTTTYYVQTTVAGCTGARTPVTVNVNSIPAAPTAADATICDGSTATLTATAPGGTYEWYDAATGGTLLITNASYTTPALSTTTTYYVQTTAAGCTGTRTPVTVNVNPIPVAPTASGTTICSGNTATITATAPGGTYDWYDASTGGNLLTSNASYTTPVLTGTTTYYVQTTVSGCTGTRTAVTVTVNPIPAAPTAANVSICNGSSATLKATAPGGTYQWYDAATGGTLLITNANYTTPALTSNTTYYVQTTIAGCTSATRTAVNVTVNPIPSSPTASGTTICSKNATTLSATAPGGTYKWYTASTGGTLLFTSANYTTATLTTTTTYYVQTTVAGCTSAARTAVTVTVTPTDDPSFNYSSGTYCITGTDPTPSITGGFPGNFSASPAGLSINASNGTIDVSASTIGTYSVVYTTTGPCPASDTVAVTITNALDATFSYSGPYCSGGSNPSPTFSGGGSAGVFSATPAGLTFVSTSSGTINVTASTPGTYTVTNSIAASGGCAAASHSATVTINPGATVNAGVDQTICAGSTATLAGTIGGSATSGTWSGGTGSFSSSTNLNATYTPGPNETTATLTLTTNDPAGPCGSVNDVVVITIRKDTSSFNYASGTYCISGSNPIPVVNGGYTGTFSSTPAGLSFVSNSTGEINLSGSTLNTYTVTFTTNGSCPDASTASITVTNAPDATFSYSGPYCQSSSNPSPTFGGGASAGTFSASPAGLSFVSTSSGTIDLTATTPGTYTVINSIAAGGGCAATSNSATVTIDPAATVDAGPGQNICAGSTATLAGTLGGAAISGTWSGGTGSFSSNSNLNAVYTPGPGETTAILTLTTNDPAGPCPAASDTVVIKIHPHPAAPTASNDTICSGSTATLMATAPGGTYAWYTAASGGTLLITGASYTTPALTSNTTYYVQTTASGCTSTSRTPVTVTVDQKAIVSANSDQTLCSNNPNATLNGSVTNAGGGIWTSTGSGTFFPNTTTLNATYTPSAADTSAGSVMLILSSTNNGACPTVIDTMLVAFSPKPVVNAGADKNICKSSVAAALNGTVSGGATTGKWTTSGTGTFTPNDTTLNATYTPSSADTTAGTVTLYLTSTNNGGCIAVKDTLKIIYTNMPTVSAGSNQTVCANNANVSLSGSSSTGTGTWSSNGSGTFTPNNTTLNATYIPSALDTAAGSVTLTLTATGGCSAVSKNITITITDAPKVNAGADQSVCPSNLTVTLAGNVSGASTTGKWTTTGTGTFTPNDSTLNATYTMTTADTLAGSIKLVLTSSNIGNCSIVKDTINVTYAPAPIANAGSDMIACTNNVAQLNGKITGGTGTGTWTTTNGTGTFAPNNTILNATYTPSNADTLTKNIKLVLTSAAFGACPSSSDTVVITVNPGPTVNAGADKTICANSFNVNLSGAVTHATGGKWTTSGTGIFTPNDSTLTTSYIPSAADTSASVIYLVLHSSGNGTCTSVVDTMRLTFSPKPVVKAGADKLVCKSSINSTLNGSVTGGATTGKWTTSGSGTFTPNDTTLNATYIPSNADTTAGTVTLYLASTNNGGCIAVNDTLKITYTNTPTVSAGSNQTVCANNASAALNGTSSTGTGTWSTSGDGTFAPNANTLNATYTPGVNDTTAKTVTLTLTATGGCAPVSKNITITISPSPIVSAGNDQSVCANNLTVTLNGNVKAGASKGKWTTTGTGTFAPNDSTLNATYTMTTADTTAGSIYLVLTSSNNGNCNAVKDTVKLTYTPSPVAHAGADVVVCANNAATLSGSITGGSGAGKWTTTNGTGSFVPNNTTLNASYIPGNADTTAKNIILVLTSTGGCAPSTDTMIVTVKPGPVVSAGVDQAICPGIPTVSLAGSVINASGGNWTTSGSGTFTPNNSTLNASYTPSTADTAAGSIYLVLTSTGNGSCSAVTDTMKISFISAPLVNAGADQSVCKSAATASLNGIVTKGATTGKWTTSGSGSFIPNDTALNASYVPSTADTTAGSVTLILTSTNNGSCNAGTDTVKITYINTPVVNAGSNQTVCANNSAAVLNGSISLGSGTWSSSGNGTFSPNNTTLNATYIAGSNDTATVTLTLTATGCASASKSITITYTPAPVVTAGSDQVVCANNLTVTLNGNVTAGASKGKWTTSGTGTFAPNDSTLNATYTMTTADTTAGSIYLVLTSSNNGNCNAVKDTVKLTYTPSPVANAGADMVVCANNAATLNGSITGGSGAGKWTTTNGTGSFVPNNTTLNASYIPGSADTTAKNIILVLTSTGGCAPSTDTMIVTVNPGPVVNAGVDQIICVNNPLVNLSGAVKVATGGKWTTSGNGTFAPNDSTLNASYTPSATDITNGNVTLVLTSSGNGQCTPVTDTMKISFSPAPTVNAGADLFICLGTMTTSLNGTVSGGSTKGKWTTMGSGTFTPNDSTLNATYHFSSADTTAGSVKLVLTSTNNGNCIATTDTVLATISPVPTVAAGNDTTICANSTVTLSGVITGGAGTGKWTTSGSGTFAPNDSTLNATYTPSATDITAGSVKLFLTATKACTLVRDSIIVTLTPAPTANAGNDTIICGGLSMTINLHGKITGAGSAQWSTTGTGTFAPNNTTLNATYTPSIADFTAGKVKLALTTSGSGNCVASDTMIATIGPHPVADFVVSSKSCMNSAIQFTDSSTISSGTITGWHWDFGNGTSTLQNPTNIYTSAGIKSVRLVVTTNAGCVDSTMQNIVVHTLPTPAFTFTTGCPDSAAFTDGSTVSPGNITTWYWTFGDSTISNLQNPSHTYASAGSHAVTLAVTSNFGCVASILDTVKVDNCTDKKIVIGNPAVPTAFTPNNDGHNDILYVKGGPFKTLSFRVFNEWGNEIFNSSNQSVGWDGTFKGMAQPAGTYVWTVVGTTVDDKEIKMVGGVTLIR